MALRKREGKPLPETSDVKVWREEFNENFKGKKPLLGTETEQGDLEEEPQKAKRRK